MRRYFTPALIVAAALSQPLTAFAQDPCPPGAWFCQPNDAAAPSSDVDASEADALPPPPPADSLPVPDDDATAREGRMPPPPVVVYQPRQTATPRARIIIIAPGGTHVVRKAPPPVVRPVVVRKTRVRATYSPACFGSACKKQPAWRSEWGLNARVEGVGFGGDGHGDMAAGRDAGMGGFGISLRYRPWARLAFDAGFDIVGGTDFNGFERVETPFSLNGIFYFNPRSRAQFYLIGGVNWSSATVRSSSPSPLLTPTSDGNGYSADYEYFGGQLGTGLEFRLSKRLAFNVDALGFIRSRTDVDDDHHRKDGQTGSAKAPEYANADTGQTTNKSGGVLFRGGLTLWW